ncbi:mercuric ion transport protein [Modicisalibacter xianhensis]|uniref:Mercuric transport protein MerT n=1 Tax=Modicisalibacter xianhensis TaxID=442341 RepID=A0A4V3GSA5_9GAMM|nr:mercuric transporter MerT family protein [Halomonas xianhensis]TDX22123.1 mercuric ion transport protein [Halomonas xianhensis]
MDTSKDQTLNRGEQTTTSRTGRKGLLASGSVIGAVLASSCCILPLVLFSLGISGAWMSNLAALEPYQPVFLVFTLVMLGVGFYTVYRKSKTACRDDACGTQGYCGTPLADRVIKIALWSATALVVLALAWPYIAPLFLG